MNPRIPVILTGCTGGWTANGWTSEGLLSRYEDHVLWNIDYEVGRLNVVSYLSGKQLLDIKKENSSSMVRSVVLRFSVFCRRIHMILLHVRVVSHHGPPG